MQSSYKSDNFTDAELKIDMVAAESSKNHRHSTFMAIKWFTPFFFFQMQFANSNFFISQHLYMDK